MGRRSIVDVEKLKELRAKGLTNREIGKAIGCAESTVVETCRALGLPNRTSVRDAELVKVWGEPISIPAMAKLLKTSEDTIRKAAKRLGLPKRYQGNRTKVDVPLLFRLWHEDITRQELAERVGVAQSTLGVLAKKHGLPKRKPCTKTEIVDPTPQEIADRARECREKHYAQRRNERDETVRAKVLNWDRGIFNPAGARV